MHGPFSRKFLWVAIFGSAFGFVEASVVVYLRGLYYPDGFAFPLRLMIPEHYIVEIAREAATIAMLVAVACVAGTGRWMRFGFFLICFGVWDLFYYAWLRVTIDWPATLVDWDILFLIPIPWIGPVIAPVLTSLLMIACGAGMVSRIENGATFRPGVRGWLLALGGTVVLLHSFIADTAATLGGSYPLPYRFEELAAALLFYAGAYVVGFHTPRNVAPAP